MLEVSLMTAPDPKTMTVLVDSEKGSRLSLPSAVRAPLTVIGISSATGCCLVPESLGDAADPERAVLSEAVVGVSESLVIGGMACTPLSVIFLRPSPKGSSATACLLPALSRRASRAGSSARGCLLYLPLRREAATIVRAYHFSLMNTCSRVQAGSLLSTPAFAHAPFTI